MGCWQHIMTQPLADWAGSGDGGSLHHASPEAPSAAPAICEGRGRDALLEYRGAAHNGELGTEAT